MRKYRPRCTGIGRNKQGVFLKGFALVGTILGTDLPSLVPICSQRQGKFCTNKFSPFWLALGEATALVLVQVCTLLSDMLLHIMSSVPAKTIGGPSDRVIMKAWILARILA